MKMNEETILQYSKDLTLNYLKKIKADVTNSDGLYSVSIPTEYVKLFGEKSSRITFDPEIASTYSCELVVPGSNFLSIVLNETKKQAPVTCGIVTKKVDNLSDHVEQIQTHNCKISLRNHHDLEKSAVRFYFLISLKSIKNVTMLKWVDVSLPGLNILNLPSKIETNQIDTKFENVADEQPIDHAYSTTIAHLEIEMTPLVNKYVTLTETNMSHSVDSVNALYKKRIEEIKQDLDYHRFKIKEYDRKITNARHSNTMTNYVNEKQKAEERFEKVKQHAIKKIEELSMDQRNELKSIGDRFRPTLEFSLIAAQLYKYNSSNCNILLQNTFTEKQINLEFVHPSSEFFKECELCKKPMDMIHLCTNSHISCDACTLHCLECQKDVCLKCQEELSPCYICKDGLCTACFKKCKICSETSCSIHSMSCRHCSELICFFCTDTCQFCLKKSCEKSFSMCNGCGKRTCFEDSKNCIQCMKEFCPNDRRLCPICDNSYCMSDSLTCEICVQSYNSNCITNKICQTCRTFTYLDREHPSVQSLILKNNEFRKYKKWEMAQNNKFLIFKVKKFLGSRIIVVEKETANVIFSKKGGIF